MVFALLTDAATVDELAEIVLTAKYGDAAGVLGYPWTDLLAEDGVVFDCGGVECAPDAPVTRAQVVTALETAGDNPPPGLLTGDPWTLVTVGEAQQLFPPSSMTIDTWQYDP